MNNVDVIKDKKDIEKIKKILLKSDYRNYLMFVIGINSGLRITQILSLKISDLIDSNGTILNEVKFNEIGYPLNNCIKTSLKQYIHNNNLVNNKEAYIFKSKRGNNPIERTQAYRIINDACKQAGINLKIGTHTLRKTFGYHFYVEYKDLKYLQKLFNHSSIKTTSSYIGLEKSIKEKKYNSFNL